MISKIIISIAVLIGAIPFGYYIAARARDELLQGRKWFVFLMIISFVGGIFLFAIEQFAGAFGFCFILLATLVSYWKSFDKKFVRKAFKSTR